MPTPTQVDYSNVTGQIAQVPASRAPRVLVQPYLRPASLPDWLLILGRSRRRCPVVDLALRDMGGGLDAQIPPLKLEIHLVGGHCRDPESFRPHAVTEARGLLQRIRRGYWGQCRTRPARLRLLPARFMEAARVAEVNVVALGGIDSNASSSGLTFPRRPQSARHRSLSRMPFGLSKFLAPGKTVPQCPE